MLRPLAPFLQRVMNLMRSQIQSCNVNTCKVEAVSEITKIGMKLAQRRELKSS